MDRKIFSTRTLLLSLVCLITLTAITGVLMPKRALANDEMQIKGTFTVAYSASPNASGVSFCGGKALDIAVEAHGSGYSTLGPLSLSLHKTLEATGPLMHGCLVLTAPDGDTLTAIYVGTEGPQNANNFSDATITLSFTGGTGRFRDAKGHANMTAVFSNFYPANSFAGGTIAPLQGVAFYSVDGTLSLE